MYILFCLFPLESTLLWSTDAMKVEDLLKYVGVHPEKLNKRISDDHICEIALFLTEWKTVAPFLGLDENELDAIEEEEKKEQVKKLKALQKWKSKTGFQATYRKVVQVLLKLEKVDVAEKVCRLLKGICLLHTCTSLYSTA